ncbi:MAG TPA: ABC transporter ATP-binding protein [Treponemataceae bacterium]|nr:ABC transporter ATP-binding protein [Treponemataceae bacterium]
MTGKTAKRAKGARADRIFNYWKLSPVTVACIVAFGLSFNVLMVAGPIWQGKLIDGIVAGVPATTTIAGVASFIALILAIQTLRYFKRFFIRRFANRTGSVMRRTIYRNIMSMEARELERETTGNLMTRAISDVDLCVEGMRKFTTELFDTGVLLASYFVSLLAYDAGLTLAASFFIPVAMLLARWLKSAVYRRASDLRKKTGEVAGITYSSIENAMLFRARGLESVNRSRYEAELEELTSKAIRAGLLEDSMQPIYNAIAMLGAALVLYFGGMRAIGGSWTIGQFSAYLSIFAAMAYKASKASKLFNSVQKSQVSWGRVKPYLGGDIAIGDESRGNVADADADTSDPARTDDRRASEQRAGSHEHARRLQVTDLSVRYAGATSDAVSGISFSGDPGEIIGITGPIACGKSTIAAAIAGLYPYGGSVRVDGRELRELDPATRSAAISWMGHRADLFSDTILENLALGDDTDVAEALADARLTEDLSAMPDGILTRVGNAGIRLSGGQQARVALARALLGKKEIIALDDPFAAVDVKTEGQIIQSFKERYQNSLIILVSHRLTAFPLVDRVLLIGGDGKAEIGTHRELLERSEPYRELYSLQCGPTEARDEP